MGVADRAAKEAAEVGLGSVSVEPAIAKLSVCSLRDASRSPWMKANVPAPYRAFALPSVR